MFRLPRFRTGSRPGGKKAEQHIATDYLDTVLSNFSGYIAADELYDGPFCVLSIVDNHNFQRLVYEVLDHDPTHDDIIRFFRRFKKELDARGLTLKGVTTDGSPLYAVPIAQVFGDNVRHQVCVFHVIKELTKVVIRAVAKVRKQRCTACEPAPRSAAGSPWTCGATHKPKGEHKQRSVRPARLCGPTILVVLVLLMLWPAADAWARFTDYAARPAAFATTTDLVWDYEVANMLGNLQANIIYVPSCCHSGGMLQEVGAAYAASSCDWDEHALTSAHWGTQFWDALHTGRTYHQAWLDAYTPFVVDRQLPQEVPGIGGGWDIKYRPGDKAILFAGSALSCTFAITAPARM